MKYETQHSASHDNDDSKITKLTAFVNLGRMDRNTVAEVDDEFVRFE